MSWQDGADDARLIRAFLARVQGKTGIEIGRTVPGITQTDVSRWRRGRNLSMREPKREAIRRFLEREEVLRDPFREGALYVIERLESALADVRRAIGADQATRRASPSFSTRPRRSSNNSIRRSPGQRTTPGQVG